MTDEQATGEQQPVKKLSAEELKGLIEDMNKTLKNYLLGVVTLKVKEKKENLAIINDIADPDKMPKMLKPYADKISILPLSGLWQAMYDKKYSLLATILTGETHYDNGFLKAMKAAEGLKLAVVQKFERYIMNVVLFGSLSRGQATEESDIDLAVIVDDTDLKNMSRAEARKRLMAMINKAGHDIFPKFGAIQVYLLTDVWDWIKDASPVIFTLLRDGVPLYDTGLFTPWRLLLKTGKIRPSPEAIENFQQSGKLLLKIVSGEVNELVSEKLYQAMLMPAQAALMLYGVMPMTYKEAPQMLRKIFVEQEKILEPEYPNWLEEVIEARKAVEHGSDKKISGSELQKHFEHAEKFNERMDKLYEQIKKEKIFDRLDALDKMLENAMRKSLNTIGVIAGKEVDKMFNKEIVEKDKLNRDQIEFLSNLKRLKKAREQGRIISEDVDRLEEQMLTFINSLATVGSETLKV